MLRLVAEQARELVGADCCVATVAVEASLGRPKAASYPEDERRWTTFMRWLDLLAIYRVIRQSGGSVRIAGEQLARLRPFCTADSARPLRGWLAASLTALDGSELGAIQLFDKQGAGFTGTTRPPSFTSPKWRRPPSREHGSTTSEASRPSRAERRGSRGP